MDNRKTTGEDPVVIEVLPGEAALVFTPHGLHAYLPEEMGMEGGEEPAAELPWHLSAAMDAMVAINPRLDDSRSEDEACQLAMAMLVLSTRHTVGEA